MRARLFGAAVVAGLSLGMVSCPSPGAPKPSQTTKEALFVTWIDASGNGFVSSYLIDPTTGALAEAPGSPVAAGSNPFSITSARGGRLLYVSDDIGGQVFGYYVDEVTLGLSPLTGFPLGAPLYSATDETGQTVLIANVSGGSSFLSSFKTDTVDGILSGGGTIPINGSGSQWIAADPSGPFAYATDTGTNITGYIVDPASGNLSANPVPNPTDSIVQGPQGAAIDPQGKYLFLADANGNVESYSIDPGTGALTLAFQSTSLGPTLTTMVIDPAGKYLYSNAFDLSTLAQGVGAFAINRSTGALSPVGAIVPIHGNGSVVQPAVDPSGAFIYATQGGSGGSGNNAFDCYKIDVSTGALVASSDVTTTIPNADSVTGLCAVRLTIPPTQ